MDDEKYNCRFKNRYSLDSKFLRLTAASNREFCQYSIYNKHFFSASPQHIYIGVVHVQRHSEHATMVQGMHFMVDTSQWIDRGNVLINRSSLFSCYHRQYLFWINTISTDQDKRENSGTNTQESLIKCSTAKLSEVSFTYFYYYIIAGLKNSCLTFENC